MDHWNIRMKIANRFCGKCGATFLADAPQEFCSACLLESGLFTDEDEEAINSKDAREANSRRMPHKNRAAFQGHPLADFGDYELLEEMGRGGRERPLRHSDKSRRQPRLCHQQS